MVGQVDFDYLLVHGQVIKFDKSNSINVACLSFSFFFFFFFFLLLTKALKTTCTLIIVSGRRDRVQTAFGFAVIF